MRFQAKSIWMLLIVFSLLLAGCAQGSPSGGAAQAVEGYLNALVAKDADQLTKLSCAAWEDQARTELDSLQAVAAKLDGMTCKESGEDGANKLVSCQGKIVLTYNTENMELGLDSRTYVVANENGEWLVCGYQ